MTPKPLRDSGSVPEGEKLDGSQRLVSIGVISPHPMLNDLADESIESLRLNGASSAGWDFLANLQNAYVPLNSSLPPGMETDWLYTGRGIALDTTPLNAEWLKVVREDFGLQTYWRVYLRTRYQVGSQGIPLRKRPWSLNARQNGNPYDYERGGNEETIPPLGYWIDFTEMAAAYG